MAHEAREELELTDEQLERNSTIRQTVFDCLEVLAERELEWDMQMIEEATQELQSVLKEFGYRMRYPGVVTLEDGMQVHEEYES